LADLVCLDDLDATGAGLTGALVTGAAGALEGAYVGVTGALVGDGVAGALVGIGVTGAWVTGDGVTGDGVTGALVGDRVTAAFVGAYVGRAPTLLYV
jgi:hypothetical protein